MSYIHSGYTPAWLVDCDNSADSLMLNNETKKLGVFDELFNKIIEGKASNRLTIIQKQDLELRKILTESYESRNKYRKKIPSFIDAKCEIETISAEQASPEAVANARFAEISGRMAVDLTAGLGVDSLYLSRQFQHVLSIEKCAEKAWRLCRNFRRMGIKNCTIINTTAEEFLSNISHNEIDLIFLDPDRRAKGKKSANWKYAEPEVQRILELCPNSVPIWVKQSPVFDWMEATKWFPSIDIIEATSWDKETKEIVWKFNRYNPDKKEIIIKARNITDDFNAEFSTSIENTSIPYLKQNEIKGSKDSEIYLIDPAPSIRSLHIEFSWIKSLGIECIITGRHGWILSNQQIDSKLANIHPILDFRIGTLAELRKWIAKYEWFPNPLSTRGIQAQYSSLLIKLKSRRGIDRPMWLGAAQNSKYCLCVGRIEADNLT